jgi:hypothetical protein
MAGARCSLNARRVFNEDGSASAILLAIEDITCRREADHEGRPGSAKEILLQEMQHRANSLQIIASISCSLDRNRRRRVVTSRCPPQRHVGGNCATTAASPGLNEDRDRALSNCCALSRSLMVSNAVRSQSRCNLGGVRDP